MVFEGIYKLHKDELKIYSPETQFKIKINKSQSNYSVIITNLDNPNTIRANFDIADDIFNYFVQNIVNKNKSWHIGILLGLRGTWFNDNILVILTKATENLYTQHKTDILEQLIKPDFKEINRYIRTSDNISTVKNIIKYKYILTFSLEYTDENVESIVSKIEELLLPDGIFYCYNAPSLLISYMKSRSNFKRYILGD